MHNLLKRTVGGLIFVAVVVGCLLVPWGMLALVCLLAVALSHEFYRMTVDRRFRKETVCVTLGSVVTLTLLFFHLQAGLSLRFAALGLLPVAAASNLLLFD